MSAAKLKQLFELCAERSLNLNGQILNDFVFNVITLGLCCQIDLQLYSNVEHEPLNIIAIELKTMQNTEPDELRFIQELAHQNCRLKPYVQPEFIKLCSAFHLFTLDEFNNIFKPTPPCTVVPMSLHRNWILCEHLLYKPPSFSFERKYLNLFKRELIQNNANTCNAMNNFFKDIQFCQINPKINYICVIKTNKIKQNFAFNNNTELVYYIMDKLEENSRN